MDYSVIQLTGFYMMATLAFNELKGAVFFRTLIDVTQRNIEKSQNIDLSTADREHIMKYFKVLVII